MRIPAGLRGWTYPNTADKGSSMATVNNYWHKLKSAIGAVDPLIEIKDNLHKNQKARNELYDLLDKTYYVDSLRYKIDDTTTYLESSSE
jgi:hypothetical protein